ncbi:DNA-directed DNA polymerase [Pseudomonas poae RE*1-1-14]|nr:DNA-directed DNA polymerase [Pseudomonas poae RE*1-1-14]
MTAHLEARSSRTAWDLAHTYAWTLRKKFSVVVEKTARKLAGTTCMDLEPPPKKELCCSRMFGQRLTDLAPIKEAVSTYTSDTHQISETVNMAVILRR